MAKHFDVFRFLSLFLSELRVWGEEIFILNFPGKVGIKFRSWYWSLRLHKCGSIRVHARCVISCPENISVGESASLMQGCAFYADRGFIKIGDRLSCNSNVLIDAADSGEVVIGSDVSIGPNAVIRASNHNYQRKDLVINQQGHSGGAVVIQDDVWIAANVVLVPGACIGKGAVIAAGAVVNGKIPPYSLAGGVPAKVIREECRH